jgi:hypothetical protein
MLLENFRKQLHVGRERRKLPRKESPKVQEDNWDRKTKEE